MICIYMHHANFFFGAEKKMHHDGVALLEAVKLALEVDCCHAPTRAQFMRLQVVDEVLYHTRHTLRQLLVEKQNQCQRTFTILQCI